MKIVCRLLDAAGVLLGWTEVTAIAKGDGCLWSPGPVSIPVDVSGWVRWVSLHWCEVNVETRIPLSALVRRDDDLVVFQAAAPMIMLGRMPESLPPVTVGRSVAIGVPVGQLGARG